MRGVPVAPKQKIEGRWQSGDERSLESEYQVELREKAEHAVLRQRIVDTKAVSEIPGVVPIGWSAIESDPSDGGRCEDREQSDRDNLRAARRGQFL